MNPGEAVKMDHEYKSFLAELGGGAPQLDTAPAPRGGPAGSGKEGSSNITGDITLQFVNRWHAMRTRRSAHSVVRLPRACDMLLRDVRCRPAWTCPTG